MTPPTGFAKTDWFHGPLGLVSGPLLKLKDSIFGCVDGTRNGHWSFFPPRPAHTVAITVIICIAGSDKVLTSGDVQRSGSSPEP